MRTARNVAALYDIHGNVDALRAVLDEPDVAAADVVVIGGDLVPGPCGAEVIDLVRSLADRALLIRGNGERELAALADDESRHVAAQVGEADRTWLATLPLSVVVDVDGLGPTRFCHATPRRDDEIITALTPDDDVAEVLSSTHEGVVVCGHVHVQYDRRVGSRRIVNAGSVGMAYQGIPGAYWASLGPDVAHRRTTYDVEAAARRCREVNYPLTDLPEWLVDPPTPDEVTRHFESLRTSGDATA